MIESELAFQLAVVKFDRPAQAREPGQSFARLVLAEVGERVLARRLRAPAATR
jgi:hypothetical protein